MKKNKVEAKLDIIVTDENIDDIMCSAFEGGITYWCDKAEVVGDYLGEYASEQISRDGKVLLHVIEPFEDDENGCDKEVYELTKHKLLDGIGRTVGFGQTSFIEREVMKSGKYTGRIVIDTCQVDGMVADMIVQYALFGDLIYG